MSTFFVLNLFTLSILIPIGVFIYYLQKHLGDKNGEVGVLRKTLYVVKVAWAIYLLIHIIVTTEIGKHAKTSEVLPYLIGGAVVLAIAHWWALFQFRKLMKSLH